MIDDLNLGNSLFAGLNDKNGIVVCGYEWGFSQEDQRLISEEKDVFFDKNAVTTFSNKTPAHGNRAMAWRYDKRIIRWFELWGHPLIRDDLGGNFEKCIVQMNWCNTQGHHIDENYYSKLSDPAQISNFIDHVNFLKPALILFMGSAMIDVLQSDSVMSAFVAVAGGETSPLQKVQKEFCGRRFKVGFQGFERCNVVSLPHPSSSRGLSDEYIQLFGNEIGERISRVRFSKGLDIPNASQKA